MDFPGLLNLIIAMFAIVPSYLAFGQIDLGSAADWFSGIMAGAGICLSLYFSQKSDRDADERAARSNRAIAQKTLFRLLRIVNGLLATATYYEEIKLDSSQPTWAQVKPLVGRDLSSAEDFDAEEYALFIDAGEAKFASDLSLLAERYRASLMSLQSYELRRDAFMESLPTANTVDGSIGRISLTQEQMRHYGPRAAALDDKIESMMKFSVDDKALALSVADRFTSICRRHLNDPSFPRLGIPVTDHDKSVG